MKNCLLYLIIFYVFTACTPEEKKIPKGILTVNQMKFIIWDLEQAGSLADYQQERDTTIKNLNTAYFIQVLKLHHLTKNDFFKSFNFYQSHPVLNQQLFDSVSAYAQRQRIDQFKKRQ